MKVTPNPSFLDWVPPNVKKKAEGYHLHIKLGSRNPPGRSFPGEDYRRVWTMYQIYPGSTETYMINVDKYGWTFLWSFSTTISVNFRPPNPPWVRCTIWSFETTTLVGMPGYCFRTNWFRNVVGPRWWPVRLFELRSKKHHDWWHWDESGTAIFGANDHKYVSTSCSLFTKPRKSHALV